jgi:hypothetical protein
MNKLVGEGVDAIRWRPASRSENPVRQPQPNRICIELDKGNLLRWHAWLIESLRKRYEVAVSLVATSDAVRMPMACRLAFELERLIYRIPPGAAVDTIEPCDIAPYLTAESSAVDTYDVAINFAVAGGHAKAPRTLSVFFDGAPSEIGAMAALFDDRAIYVAVEDSERPGEYAMALPALADRKIMTHVIDNACSIAIDLVIQALARLPSQGAYRFPWGQNGARPRRSIDALAYVASGVAWKANRRLANQLASPDEWSVAYRKVGGGSLLEGRRAEFTLLPNDGRRYFADPFLLRHRGRTAMFMEEFPFETSRGRISVVLIDDNGALTAPRPVIEEAYHLSYPNVFEYDGEVWMVPESGANASLDLYRAVDFPFGWRREARLLEGVIAYDATLLQNEAGWWMFAATQQRRGTGWDSLSIFHAPDLRGPWRRCQDNPVLLDARASRPAGAIMLGSGAPVRPVQDCAAFYGAAIGLWRVDRISCDAFEQFQVGRIVAGQFGVHTYNRTPEFEVVDLFGRTTGVRTATVSYKSLDSSSARPTH